MMYKNKQKLSSRPLQKLGYLRVAGSLILVAALVIAALLATHIISFSHKTKYPTDYSGSSYTKGQGAAKQTGQSVTGSSSNTNTGANTSSTSTNSQPSSQKSTSGATDTTLVAPSGDFVSAHNVNLNSELVSVCNTTPGAKCTITFTSDKGIQKALTAETTDANGSAYWNNWTPNSIGLTAGTWVIRAVATLGSQTQTSQDAINLTVN